MRFRQQRPTRPVKPVVALGAENAGFRLRHRRFGVAGFKVVRGAAQRAVVNGHCRGYVERRACSLDDLVQCGQRRGVVWRNQVIECDAEALAVSKELLAIRCMIAIDDRDAGATRGHQALDRALHHRPRRDRRCRAVNVERHKMAVSDVPAGEQDRRIRSHRQAPSQCARRSVMKRPCP